MDFQEDVIEILDITPKSLPEFKLNNFGLNKLNMGKLKTLWFQDELRDVRITKGQKILKIKVRILKSVNENNQLEFLLQGKTSSVKAKENSSFALKFKAKKLVQEHNLLNVYPNPSIDLLNFDLSLSKAEIVNVEIMTPLGKTYRFNRYLMKGQHLFTINDIKQLPSGVLFYRLKVGSETFSGNFIKN